MADAPLPMNGEHSKILLFYGGQKVPGIEGQVVSWNVSEVSRDFRDPLIGRNRHRTDKKVDGYDASLSILFADLTAINFLKSIDTTRDERGSLKELTVALQFEERTGGVEGVKLSKATAKWNLSSGGQSDRLSGSLSVQAEDYSALVL